MTFKELYDWIKSHKDLASQVVMAMQEEDEPDAILDGVGPVCYLPFVAAYFPSKTINERYFSESYRIYIELWEDEKTQKAEEFYSWGDLVKWIENMPDANIEALALVAWHKCNLKIVNEVLYAYE